MKENEKIKILTEEEAETLGYTVAKIFKAYQKGVDRALDDKKIEKIELVGCNMKVNLAGQKTLLSTENLQTEFIILKINELIDEINKLKEKK